MLPRPSQYLWLSYFFTNYFSILVTLMSPRPQHSWLWSFSSHIDETVVATANILPFDGHKFCFDWNFLIRLTANGSYDKYLSNECLFFEVCQSSLEFHQNNYYKWQILPDSYQNKCFWKFQRYINFERALWILIWNQPAPISSAHQNLNLHGSLAFLYQLEQKLWAKMYRAFCAPLTRLGWNIKFQECPEGPSSAISSWDIRKQNDSLCYASITTVLIEYTSENDDFKKTLTRVGPGVPRRAIWRHQTATFFWNS